MMSNKQTIHKQQNKKNKMLPTFRKLSKLGVRVSKSARRRFNKQQIHSIQVNPVYDLFWKDRGFKKGRPINWRELLKETGYKKEVKYEKYELNDYFVKNSRETTPDSKSWRDITFPGMRKRSEVWPNKKDLPRQNPSQELLPKQACYEDDLNNKDEYGNSPTSQQPMEYIDWPPKKGYFGNTPIKEQRLDPLLWTNRFSDHAANREEFLPENSYHENNSSVNGGGNYYKEDSPDRWQSRGRSPGPSSRKTRLYPDNPANREELRPKRDYRENSFSHIRNNKYRTDDPSHNRRPRSPHHSSSWKYRRSPDRQTYGEELRSRRDYSLKHFRKDSPPRYRRSRERSPLARDRQNSARSFYNDRRFQN